MAVKFTKTDDLDKMFENFAFENLHNIIHFSFIFKMLSIKIIFSLN
ncbi:hypothetical protein D8803_06350 [Streptococcus oralis]|uniref:Uncharacterized protein n=1 Tax=Streptococcus oralis TaxID=1303 RepID=A0A428FP02_STROR|nr:hypothetical protein D8803_06350 [Streptococcus oralis]